MLSYLLKKHKSIEPPSLMLSWEIYKFLKTAVANIL